MSEESPSLESRDNAWNEPEWLSPIVVNGVEMEVRSYQTSPYTSGFMLLFPQIKVGVKGAGPFGYDERDPYNHIVLSVNGHEGDIQFAKSVVEFAKKVAEVESDTQKVYEQVREFAKTNKTE